MATLIIIGLLAVGCSKRAPSPGVTDTEILIGNVQDLSGPMKELGAVIPSGSNLYFQYINDQGGVHGRSIKMLIEDHQYNPQKAVAATKKLVEKDQVFCLYQVIGTSPCEAIRPILSETGTPLIAAMTSIFLASPLANAKSCGLNDMGFPSVPPSKMNGRLRLLFPPSWRSICCIKRWYWESVKCSLTMTAQSGRA